jgi:trk system potassium uptake protein TrkA
MNVIICGAGEVGSHAAEVLGAATSITVVDTNADRLRAIEERLDVATCVGNCARADVLVEAGSRTADLVVTATHHDEINLLSASVAKGVGAKKSIARVHHSAYFDQRGLEYQEHLGIDRLICPEYSTALAIARTLRNPGAMAIEGFARGTIEMQEFPVTKKAPAVGRALHELSLPAGSRLAVISRNGTPFVPEAGSTLEPDDVVILVGNHDIFQEARKVFHDDKKPRQRLVMMGGTPMAVWLSRSLMDRNFALRLFETDRARAEELSEKLSWVTVIQADPTERATFDEEHLAHADVFVSLLDDDEANIIGGVLAKLRGVPRVVTVVQKSTYLDLIYDIGVDNAFSPRIVAANEILSVLDESPLRHMASLAAGVIDVYRVRVGSKAEVLDTPLKDVKLSPEWVVAAIQREGVASVPGANDRIQAGDVVLMIGREGRDRTLKKLLDVRS